jgi:hypothetical protein
VSTTIILKKEMAETEQRNRKEDEKENEKKELK